MHQYAMLRRDPTVFGKSIIRLSFIITNIIILVNMLVRLL